MAVLQLGSATAVIGNFGIENEALEAANAQGTG
jgi:hypothetical protein